MAVRKQQDLAARIPRDVVARAEKAGVRLSELDWYAGRLADSHRQRGDAPGGVGKASHRSAVKAHKRNRTQERTGKRPHSRLAMVASSWWRSATRSIRSPL